MDSLFTGKYWSNCSLLVDIIAWINSLLHKPRDQTSRHFFLSLNQWDITIIMVLSVFLQGCSSKGKTAAFVKWVICKKIKMLVGTVQLNLCPFCTYHDVVYTYKLTGLQSHNSHLDYCSAYKNIAANKYNSIKGAQKWR